MSDATLGFELLSLAPELELGYPSLPMVSETLQEPVCLASVEAEIMAQQKEKL